MAEPQKSIWRAYVCWLLGGIFGLHHFYLRNDRQAFICWSTFGGYVFGWFFDIFRIPGMVREANNAPIIVEAHKELVRKHRRPPFQFGRVINSSIVAYLWAQVYIIAIPEVQLHGIALAFWLQWLVPVVVAAAIHTVGNIGRQQGSIWLCLLAAYLVYPVRFLWADQNYWLSAVVVISALVFEVFSRQWQLSPAPKRSLTRRLATLYACGFIYLACLASYGYFNGHITQADGTRVPIREALQSALQSPLWKELSGAFAELWHQAQHRGWYGTWIYIYDQIDTGSEQRALDTLGLSATASQAEITRVFRKLSKESHPDKCKGSVEECRAAQLRFMEISQAYEKLSKSKSKRRQKNQQSTEDAIKL